MKDTDRAEEFLRAYYAMKTAAARVRGSRGVDRAAASISRHRTADRYAPLDSPRAALAAAAAAMILMAGIGLGSRWRDASPVPGCAVSLLADMGGASAGLDRALEAIRDSVPRRDMKGERL